MTETNSIKVYELAKELEIDSISLIDKLKNIDIKVKSHMSSLSVEEIEKARSALTAKTAKKRTSTKTKKKVATKTKKVVTKKKVTKKETAVNKEEEKSASPTNQKKMIIRRRSSETKAEEATQASPQKEKSNQSVYDSQETVTTPESTQETKVETQDPKETTGKTAEQKRFLTTTKHEIKKLQVQKTQKATPRGKKPTPGQKAVDPNNNIPPNPDDKPRKSRVFKVTKAAIDQIAEEESQKKKRGVKEDSLRPEDNKFSDYRKKEIFFMPKRKKVPTGRQFKETVITTPAAHKRVVAIDQTISVQDFANQVGTKASQIVKKLLSMGQMQTMNQDIDFDTATILAQEFNFEVKNTTFDEETFLGLKESTSEEHLTPRPPVVTIMGHVDHGKTTLLDKIRMSNVVDGEAGGITQHVGAYTIEKDKKLITFIDTPGHEAFSVMRARGANVTDIVIIVVAADDGAMPQTREAISHAKAAEVPIIVAINKIDKPNSNIEKIKQTLSELDLLSEDWGGDTMFIPVSAKEGTNIDQLLDAINLNAELLELKASETTTARGTVLEAQIGKGRGPIINVLLSQGVLAIGKPILAGIHAGKIKAMYDHNGKPIKTLKPGMAAEVLGLEGVPQAGDEFYGAKLDEDAKKVTQYRRDKAIKEKTVATKKMSLDQLFDNVQDNGTKELKVILKGDVFGSVEAVKESLTKTSTDKVKVNTIHAAPGGIIESDVLLASASNAIILGFNVRPDTNARKISEKEGVEIKCYKVIYELIDDIKNAMVGLLDKKKIEKFLGRAEVRETFSIPKIGTIAGSSVIDGKILRGANVRLLRDSVIIFEGKMSSLKRFKDDTKEVATGYECGIGIENFNDVKPGDIIEAFEIEMIAHDVSEL